jgi:hypothetical protein
MTLLLVEIPQHLLNGRICGVFFYGYQVVAIQHFQHVFAVVVHVPKTLATIHNLYLFGVGAPVELPEIGSVLHWLSFELGLPRVCQSLQLPN